ncbi:hypothetical protein AGMMS50222_04580 [Endomicrobiia bacterium]|nr:hypothetical protein AGMMS50222_04580 [Endomicrobiia bacterium]
MWSGGMGLVLMGVKKTFDKTKDSRERRKEKEEGRRAKRKLSIEKMVKMMFEYFRAIPEHIVTRNSYNVSKSCGYRHRVLGHNYRRR